MSDIFEKLKYVNMYKPARKLDAFEQKTGSSFKCDYHIHSNLSMDGKTEPQAIIKRAQKYNIKYIAVTDHNTLEMPIDEISKNCKYADSVFVDVGNGVKLIPAVEVTARIQLSSGKNKTVHIGVYAPDLSNKAFLRYVKIKGENERNIDYNYFISIEKCLKCNFNRDAIDRYKKYLENTDEEFKYFEREHIVDYCKNILIKNNTSEYINNIDLTTDAKQKEFIKKVEYILKNTMHCSKFNVDAVELIQKANFADAITVLMHPNATFNNQAELDEARNILFSNGLYGEEKIYADRKTMAKLTQPVENGVSGGTDSHNSKPFAIVDGIFLKSDMFPITKKLEDLENKRAQNANRSAKKVADVSEFKFRVRYFNNLTPTQVMYNYNIDKKKQVASKTEEVEK